MSKLIKALQVAQICLYKTYKTPKNENSAEIVKICMDSRTDSCYNIDIGQICYVAKGSFFDKR